MLFQTHNQKLGFVMFEAAGTAPTLVLILSLQDLKHHSTQLIDRLQ